MRISDWSSDVCSSDLAAPSSIHAMIQPSHVLRNDQTLITSCTIRTGSSSAAAVAGGSTNAAKGDRKSVVEGKSVSVRVDLGGRRIIKKKKNKNTNTVTTCASTTELQFRHYTRH